MDRRFVGWLSTTAALLLSLTPGIVRADDAKGNLGRLVAKVGPSAITRRGRRCRSWRVTLGAPEEEFTRTQALASRRGRL